MTEPIQITIPLSYLEKFKTALEAGLEAAKNEHHNACKVYGDNRPRLVNWHDNEVFIIEQALERINAELSPPR
jgi:hypothetical protein